MLARIISWLRASLYDGVQVEVCSRIIDKGDVERLCAEAEADDPDIVLSFCHV